MILCAMIILTVICGLSYWAGGQGAGGKERFPWVPAWCFDRNIRHFVCPTTVVLEMLILGHWHLSLLACWLIMAGATACYWNFLRPQADKTWWNWLLHGVGIGLSLLPWGYYVHQIPQVLAYAVGLGVTMCLWSVIISIDFFEENGRGDLMVLIIWGVIFLFK